mmetsp:Transcript_85139/g.260161  ORF Transcript_85139/g.260161 Transcript_85139/m.260161 type:complete len:303 (-) Transcript_85139:8-916(-)
MEPHVVRQRVERAIIRIRLGAALHDVVLREEVARGGMQGAGKKGAQEEVQKRLRAPQVRHREVERQLRAPIRRQPTAVGDHLGLRQAGPQRVREDLAKHEQRLTQAMVHVIECCQRDELCLQKCRDVSVDAVLPLAPVVLHVVRLERDAIRDADREVGHHGDELVLTWRLCAEVVRQLMDREEQRMVGRGADHVNGRQVVRPSPIQGQPRHEGLQGHGRKDNVLRPPLVPHELLDLGMRLEDLLPAGRVRLIRLAEDEVPRHHLADVHRGLRRAPHGADGGASCGAPAESGEAATGRGAGGC